MAGLSAPGSGTRMGRCCPAWCGISPDPSAGWRWKERIVRLSSTIFVTVNGRHCVARSAARSRSAGRVPVTGHQGVRRPAVRLKRPAQGQRAPPPHDPAGPERPQPFSALEGGDLGGGQDDLGVARHLQEVAGLEVGEDEAGPAVQEDVAERGERTGCGEVGDRERVPSSATRTKPALPPRCETSTWRRPSRSA